MPRATESPGAGKPARPLAWPVLVVLALASSVPMVLYGLQARIEYDGWWHVFVARVDVWSVFWGDVFMSAHPPLYFLLLKAVSALGTDPMVYRSLSIVAALIAAASLGLATRRVSSLRGMGVLCALAFALSTSTVIIANEVRSYMVATAFLLLALPPYLTLARPGGDARTRTRFGAFATLAALSHYGVLFPLLAVGAAPVGLGLLFPAYRRAWRSALPQRWRADLATLAPPLLVVAGAYVWQLEHYRGPMAHLPDFYYSRAEPIWGFLGRNLVRQVDLFSPLALSTRSPILQALGVASVMALPLVLLWLLRRERNGSLAALFPVTLLLLNAGLMTASVLGKYPFGGSLRHQFFTYPFAVATLFLLLDRLMARLPGTGAKRWATGLLGILVVGHAYLQWHGLPMPRRPLFQDEFDAFRQTIPEPQLVYVDGFDLFAFFSHTQDGQWTFERSTARGALQVWRVEDEDRAFRVLRDMRRWNARLDDAGLYATLGEGLERIGASSVAIFRIDHASAAGRAETVGQRRASEAAITRVALSQHLAPRRIVRSGRARYLELMALDPASPDGPPGLEIVDLEARGLAALPNPIRVCPGEKAGVTTLSWRFPGKAVEIRLGSPDGKLWTAGPSEGSATTGPWVTDGMTFFAQDSDSTPPTSPESTLGTVVVHHTDAGCPGR